MPAVLYEAFLNSDPYTKGNGELLSRINSYFGKDVWGVIDFQNNQLK